MPAVTGNVSENRTPPANPAAARAESRAEPRRLKGIWQIDQ